MTSISREHYTDVCKIGQGRECCRYVVGGPGGLECGKLTPSLKAAIDQRAESMVAQSDNCPGWGVKT